MRAACAHAAHARADRAGDTWGRRFLAAKGGADFSDEELADIVLNFIIAGRDTTACCLSWASLRSPIDACSLVHHPKEFQRFDAAGERDTVVTGYTQAASRADRRRAGPGRASRRDRRARARGCR